MPSFLRRISHRSSARNSPSTVVAHNRSETPTHATVPPDYAMLHPASMSEDDVFAYVHELSEARGSEGDTLDGNRHACEVGDPSLPAVVSDKPDAPQQVKAPPWRLSMKEHVAAAKPTRDLVIWKQGERNKVLSAMISPSPAEHNHGMTEMDLDKYVDGISAPASGRTTNGSQHVNAGAVRGGCAPALAYHALKADESAKLDAEEEEGRTALEEDAATLAYKLFAHDELASLEQREAEEMRLLREEESEEAVTKVLQVITSEAWQRLSKYRQAWYVENARWELAQRRSGSPTTATLSALRAPMAARVDVS